MLNETTQISIDDAIAAAQAPLVIPSLIILLVGMLITFIVVGMCFVQRDRGKLWKIVGVSGFFSLVLLAAIALLPHVVADLAALVTSLVK